MTTSAGTTPAPQYASPVDYDTYGPYGPGRGFDRGQEWRRPRYRFQGRITADGSSGFPAEPGRYHLYISWGCPWAQRTAIVRKLMRLDDVVSLSYVDDVRDARGWAFRERRGPDPVNGFTFLAQAYEATEPGYDGHVSVPVLWDRVTGKIVSNNFPDITIDLGTAFGAWADRSAELYPEPLRAEIDALNERVYNGQQRSLPGRRGHHPGRLRGLRQAMIATLDQLDERLAEPQAPVRRPDHRGRHPAVADPRPLRRRLQPDRRGHERRLTDFPNLWAYARDLYQRPAFRDTTDFSSFGGLSVGPSRVSERRSWRIKVEPRLADWDTPSGRERSADRGRDLLRAVRARLGWADWAWLAGLG